MLSERGRRMQGRRGRELSQETNAFNRHAPPEQPKPITLACGGLAPASKCFPNIAPAAKQLGAQGASLASPRRDKRSEAKLDRSGRQYCLASAPWRTAQPIGLCSQCLALHAVEFRKCGGVWGSMNGFPHRVGLYFARKQSPLHPIESASAVQARGDHPTPHHFGCARAASDLNTP